MPSRSLTVSVACTTPMMPGSTPRTPASLQLRTRPGGGRAESRRADQQHLGAEELALALLAHLVQQEVPAVALDLLGLERPVFHHREARLRPLLEAALEIGDVLVAQILEGLGRQHGTEPALAVEADRGRDLVGRPPQPE